MDWDHDRFERFVVAVRRMAKGQLPGYGYPHVVLPYPPRQEHRAIQEARRLPTRLGDDGLLAETIPVAQVVAEQLRRYARRPLRDADEYRRTEQDFADPSGGLVKWVAEACAKRAEAHLAGDAVMVLARLGGLFPFCQVSTLLEALYVAGVKQTVAVLYPGTADGTRLRFLGLVDATGGYRGHVVT